MNLTNITYELKVFTFLIKPRLKWVGSNPHAKNLNFVGNYEHNRVGGDL